MEIILLLNTMDACVYEICSKSTGTNVITVNLDMITLLIINRYICHVLVIKQNRELTDRRSTDEAKVPPIGRRHEIFTEHL